MEKPPGSHGGLMMFNGGLMVVNMMVNMMVNMLV